MSEDGITRLFGKTALEKLKGNSQFEPFFKDPDFVSMCNVIADNPNDIVKFQDDPKMQTLLAALPTLLSMYPKDGAELDKPPPEPLSDDAETERIAGNECFKKKDFNGALRHYNRAIEIDPKNIVYYSNKTTALLQLERYQDAMEAALLGIEQAQLASVSDEMLAKIYVKLSYAASGCGKDRGAFTALQEALNLQPNDPAIKKLHDDLKKKLDSQKL